MIERVAIVGTAQSWVKTPWNDPGLHIVSLNDAYRMPGFVRADRWYDLHPVNHFFYLPPDQKAIMQHQIPFGHYVRPQGHLEWLAKQSIPVYLHPDWQQQDPPEALRTARHVHAFPKAAIEAELGDYFTSSPGWMLAHLFLEGVRQFHIYGIHLATEHEYIEQRPNFEFLIGRILGPGRCRITVTDGMRRYETPDGMIELPEASPVLSSDFQYAFEPRPRTKYEPLKWELQKAQIKRERAIAALKVAPWWQPKRKLQDALWMADARAEDAQETLARAMAPRPE